MQLQVEQIGNSVDVLEVTVTMHPKEDIGVRLRPQVVQWQDFRKTDIQRWPDMVSSNVQDVLPSITMGASVEGQLLVTLQMGQTI